MKLKFLAAGAEECPLVRLFHFVPDEVELLRQVCRKLADSWGAIALHDQSWVEPVDGCRLVFHAATDDVGVTMSAHASAFTLALSPEGWREAEEKLMALLTGAGGWNWLADEGDVRVLVSPSGQW